MFTFIKSFLVNRTHCVCINGYQSHSHPVISGVPQGSVLGPLIFLIMISDIDEGIQYSHCSSFADDTRLLELICELLNVSLLQMDLIQVYTWSTNSNIVLNGEKFECM